MFKDVNINAFIALRGPLELDDALYCSDYVGICGRTHGCRDGEKVLPDSPALKLQACCPLKGVESIFLVFFWVELLPLRTRCLIVTLLNSFCVPSRLTTPSFLCWQFRLF